jgi:protoheme IX farnesyltransferase
MACNAYKAVDDTVWARKLFVFSIFTITALSVMMSLDFQVPKELLLTYAH